MRVCESCGRENVDRNKFCVWCGHTFLKDEPEEETAVQEAAPFEEVVAAEENLPAEGNAAEEPVDTAGYPLKWHKFMVVVLLIAGIWSICQGIAELTGTWYEVQGVDAKLLYRVYPALKTLDWLLAVFTVGLGVFRFTVRKRLKHFMESGPRSLIALYAVSIGVSVIYLIACMAVTGIAVSAVSKQLVTIAGSFCMMFVQKYYYDKRKELFVN